MKAGALKKAIPRLLNTTTRKVFSRSAHENRPDASTSSPDASWTLPPTLPDFSFITLDEHLPLTNVNASKSWETFELALPIRASRSSTSISLAADTFNSVSIISSSVSLATPSQSDASFIVATDASHNRDSSPLLLSPWTHPSSQLYHQSPALDSNLSLGVFIPESLLMPSPKTPEAVSSKSYQDQMEIQALHRRIAELEQECAELREDNKIIYENFLSLRQETKRLNKRVANLSVRTTAYGSDYGIPIVLDSAVEPVSTDNIADMRVTMLDVPHGAAQSCCSSPLLQYDSGPSHFRQTASFLPGYLDGEDEDYVLI